MTPEIIAIVTVGVALAGLILTSGLAGCGRTSTNCAARSGHSANAWRTWKG